MQIGDLLTEPVADVSLLSKGVGSPDGQDRNHGDHDGAAYSKRAGAHIARGNYGFAVSHAASLVDTRVDEVPTIANAPRVRPRRELARGLPAFRLLVAIEIAEGHTVFAKGRLGVCEAPPKALSRDP
jgi:hypothetical protein